MTVNDKDMDVLMRRYAASVAKAMPVGHPDADELNAFAEGKLPAAARQRYVSHLADCDDCRKLVSQLAVAAGVVAETRVPASQPDVESWWQKLSAVFALPIMRYAAFTVVLLAVVGISFLVWRRPTERNADLIAQHQPQTQPIEAVKSETPLESESLRQYRNENTSTSAISQPTPASGADQKKLESTAGDPPPPKPADVMTEKEAAVAAARPVEQPKAQSSPSYAPAPRTETYSVESRAREQIVGPTPGGPRRNESYEKYKTVDRSRSADLAKDRDEDRNRAANQPAATEDKQDDATTRGRTASGVASVGGHIFQEMRVEARKSEGSRATSEETPETRSVGGRKFKRQGNAWVDSKFKSSMSVRNVTRGSEEFDKLDSGLRSIAQQLRGEIVVVWKGNAYRIK